MLLHIFSLVAVSEISNAILYFGKNKKSLCFLGAYHGLSSVLSNLGAYMISSNLHYNHLKWYLLSVFILLVFSNNFISGILFYYSLLKHKFSLWHEVWGNAWWVAQTRQLDLPVTRKIRPVWVHHWTVLIGKPNGHGNIPIQKMKFFQCSQEVTVNFSVGCWKVFC